MRASRTFKYGAHDVTIETGVIARQADGAVLVNMADTVVLVTAVGDKKDVAGRDFFPLTVNYQEKTYAAGKIPGGFFKREGRPSEKETLTSRLIDRPIRPLVPAWLPPRRAGDRDSVVDEHRNRSGHPGAARCLRGARDLGVAVHGPDRRRASRLQGRSVLAESDERGAPAVEARSRRGRHARGRAHGRIASRPAVGRRDARRRDVRPRADASCDRSDSLARQGSGSRADRLDGAGRGQGPGVGRRQVHPAITDAYGIAEKQTRYAKIGELKKQCVAELTAREGNVWTAGADRRRVPRRRKECRAQPHHRGQAAHRRPRHEDRPQDRCPGRRSAAHARLGRVHAWRDPGLGRHDSRHGPRCADHRRARRRAARPVHAPLQLPAVQRWRDRLCRLAEAARDRPRPPGAPRRRGRDARHGNVPVRHSRRVGDHGVERLELDGQRLRHQLVADGRRRADQGSGRRCRDGPDQGRRTRSSSSPTSSATRTTSATWTSRSPAPPTA